MQRSRVAGRATKRAAFLVLGAASLLVLASLRPHQQPNGLDLVVEQVPLNPSDPRQSLVGPLRFRGGLWLRSVDPRFGGLSDLRVDRDGSHLLAVSDCGYGFSATLVYDARGHLVDLRAAQLLELTGKDGAPLVGRQRDAESLALDSDARLLVGFEGRPRIWRYSRMPPFAGPPEPEPLPSVEEECSSNSGLETLVALGAGRLFMVCEAGGARDDATIAWVGRGETWRARPYPLTREGLVGAFRPTGAAVLPDGDVVVLERRFPPLGMRLVRLSKADLEGEGPLSPEEFVRLEPPLSLDNFEGIDTRRDASGATLLYILSDDNGCSKRPGVHAARLQRSLLLLFELAG
jgi:hypothetical protein